MSVPLSVNFIFEAVSLWIVSEGTRDGRAAISCAVSTQTPNGRGQTAAATAQTGSEPCVGVLVLRDAGLVRACCRCGRELRFQTPRNLIGFKCMYFKPARFQLRWSLHLRKQERTCFTAVVDRCKGYRTPVGLLK